MDHSEITERVLTAARDLALLASSEVWVLHLREREVMPRAGLIATETNELWLTLAPAVGAIARPGKTGTKS